MGPPNLLELDQGPGYISKKMTGNRSASGVSLKEEPIETPGIIVNVERYDGKLRGALENIGMNLDRLSSDADCLQQFMP